MTQQNPALQKIGELLEPLSSTAGAIIGDKMYAAGGAAPGSTVIAKMWVRSAPSIIRKVCRVSFLFKISRD